MQKDIQKASLWKRIAAGILDLILLAVLATGIGWGLSWILQYDSQMDHMEQIYQSYVDKYGIREDLTVEQFQAMTPQEQAAYTEKVEAADAAIEQDQEASRQYMLVINLSLIIATGGILIAILLLEFVVPLIFGNGQTLGKKVFALCVIRNDGVKLNNLQLFARVILGKFAVETMIPVYTAVMMLMGSVDIFLIAVVGILLIAQCICMAVTKNNCLLHDLMAGTVVADFGSQQIFKSTEDLVAYQKRIAAERAARQTY